MYTYVRNVYTLLYRLRPGEHMVIERNRATWQLDGNSIHLPSKGVVLLRRLIVIDAAIDGVQWMNIVHR